MTEHRIRPLSPIKVITERSVWLITPTHYRRTRVHPSGMACLDGSLDYDRDIPYREAFLVSRDDGTDAVRLVPSDRWWGAYGIITGPIVNWELAEVPA